MNQAALLGPEVTAIFRNIYQLTQLCLAVDRGMIQRRFQAEGPPQSLAGAIKDEDEWPKDLGKYLERTYGFVERVGIETLRNILVEDSLGICTQLDAEIQKAVDAYRDPWKEAELPAYPAQFSGPELARALEVAENNG